MATKTKGGAGKSWRLQDAKARFSELVRRAEHEGPQRVTVHGRDAVVIVSAKSYDREQRRETGQGLIDAMAKSPHRDIDIEVDRDFAMGPVRDIRF